VNPTTPCTWTRKKIEQEENNKPVKKENLDVAGLLDGVDEPGLVGDLHRADRGDDHIGGLDRADQAAVVVQVALDERDAGLLEALEQLRLGRVGRRGVPDQREGGVAQPRARRHDVPAQVPRAADHQDLALPGRHVFFLLAWLANVLSIEGLLLNCWIGALTRLIIFLLSVTSAGLRSSDDP
jgi:hypothetical protein